MKSLENFAALNEEARRLRDALYEIPLADEKWNCIAPNWIKDIEWLRKHYDKLQGTLQKKNVIE